ncbi:fic/DOC family protein [Colletotrichum salicis]|uniref:Fic/DOC family protein n=1 Tax=Colletotrichum salicis TaxID=1209931 RepID=A0A135UTM6_9PEZI|nr:fic/DOC family protein [Colletotrichum salicis]
MSNRIMSSTQQERLALLKKIYKPAARLQKGSIEYENLARSGRVWEDYFTPGNSLKMGRKCHRVSHERAVEPHHRIAMDRRERGGQGWYYRRTMRSRSTRPRRGVRSTTAGGNLVWGSRVPLGEYRNLPISVRSNRLRIFPYPQEVPAYMQRFFQWRDLQRREKALHPLILACQMTSYFVLVHPFPDGNGRTSRMVKQDYLARQGYVPVVIRDLKREDYLRMIDGAGEGKPEEFATAVLEAQLAVLHQAPTRLET